MENGTSSRPFRIADNTPSPFERVDANVREKLPEGSEVVRLAKFGKSFWSFIGRLDVKLGDGSPQSYLLKATPGEAGRGISEGEFASMSALHAVTPEFVPRPVAWGSYRDVPDMHFFLAEFLELLEGELPAPERLARSLAGLHRGSAVRGGRYGFHAETWSGVVRRENAWCDTWEEYYARELRRRFALERTRHPEDPEMGGLSAALVGTAVPRLLRPLTALRSIEPVLVHGDLWNGNIAMKAETREPVIFDAGCAYGHNEYEIGVWTCERYGFSQEHIDAYCRHFPPAEPVEDFADRALLYAVSINLCASYVHGDPVYRVLLKKTMKYLLDKYPGGYEEWAKQNAHRIAACEPGESP